MVLHRRKPLHRKRDRTHTKISRVKIGLWLIAVGFLLITFPIAYRGFPEETSEPIHIDSQLLRTAQSREVPIRIIIPTVNVDLPVVEAPVVRGLWELSETTASHGIGSASPGEAGNTVIFAHARDELFGPIRELKNGDVVYVLTKDSWHKYTVSETKLVNPKDVEVIAPTPDETLTLFTCSGFLDSKRLIVVAKP